MEKVAPQAPVLADRGFFVAMQELRKHLAAIGKQGGEAKKPRPNRRKKPEQNADPKDT